jgi:predicted nucleic acid-binding protein
MIAAHTQPVDAVLITDNTKQFDRVAAVRTDNWLATR